MTNSIYSLLRDQQSTVSNKDTFHQDFLVIVNHSLPNYQNILKRIVMSSMFESSTVHWCVICRERNKTWSFTMHVVMRKYLNILRFWSIYKRTLCCCHRNRSCFIRIKWKDVYLSEIVSFEEISNIQLCYTIYMNMFYYNRHFQK